MVKKIYFLRESNMNEMPEAVHLNYQELATGEFLVCFNLEGGGTKYIRADLTTRPAMTEAMKILQDAVLDAEVVFRHYAELHLAKGTRDGAVKADNNTQHANRMRSAIRAALSAVREGK